MNVLVIEDDATDLKLFCSILVAEGHEVVTARNAEQAMQVLAHTKPHIILTDLALPDVDGVTLTKRLKISPDTVNIPVVAVTAYMDRFPRRIAQREAGFAD